MSALKKNYTVVIVTHNMQQAARISDRTAFFLLGELVEAIDIVPFGYADTLRGQAETEENEAYE